jgi:hypothetical protein
MALPVPSVWGVLEVCGRWGYRIRPRRKEIVCGAHERGSKPHTGAHGDTRPAACTHSRSAGSPARQSEVKAGDEHRRHRASRRTAKADLARPPCRHARRRPSLSRRLPPHQRPGPNPLPVIDWPDACCGDPAAGVCRSYLLLKLHAGDIAEPYLDAYCSITNMARANILDWLPYVAAARLAEDVPDDWAKSVTMPQDDRAVLVAQRRRSSSISSSVRGQSSCIRRDSARSARSRPPVWQHAQ